MPELITQPTSVTTPPSQPRQLEIAGDGQWRSMPAPPASLLRRFPLRKPYRLYRFLTDLEDLFSSGKPGREQLRIAAVLTRHLLEQSSWIAETCPQPDAKVGWGVAFLYDEPQYPFTVQVVSWMPGESSPVHNHAAWSLVTLLGDPEIAGREHNTFWRRQPAEKPEETPVEVVSELLLYPGDLIGFTPEAIHSVRSVPADPENSWPTFTFNVYAETDYRQRYEFDPETGTAVLF